MALFRALSIGLTFLMAAGLAAFRVAPVTASPGQISHFVAGNLGRGQATTVTQGPGALALVGSRLLVGDGEVVACWPGVDVLRSLPGAREHNMTESVCRLSAER